MQDSIPWREYLRTNPEIRYRLILAGADNFLQVMGTLYNLSTAIPPILISTDPEFNAEATPDNEIHIALGLLQKSEICADLASRDPAIPDRDSIVTGKMRTIVFWAVAHEFFHIARSHFEVLELHGPSARKPLEFDADMMAVAGLYRYFRTIPGEAPPIDIKLHILNGIFWAIREQICSNVAEPYTADPNYPTWHLRIWNAFIKLVQIDNKNWIEEVGRARSEKADLEFQILLHSLVDCDNAYCALRGLPHSTFAQFIHTRRNVLDYGPLSSAWEKIEQSIFKLQRICKPRT